jgi:hypothetical protein
MLESSVILKIMKEENPECLKEEGKDGLKITLISLADLLKKNNNIEIISKLIWKKTPRMTSLMSS